MSRVKRMMEDSGEIGFDHVTNDGSDESSIKLIALKNIFSRQLPKMPRDYIVRLVFDYRHWSVAITKGKKIIGGICYRAFKEQKFAEIAFLAINSNEQVRGYGTILMNQMKFVAQRNGLEYFVTYADNFATGYFQKQGFSKHITMHKDRWFGYIKDYDGGTLMECYVHPGYPYHETNLVVQKQRQFILERLKSARQDRHLIPYQHANPSAAYTSTLEIPGVVEAGWNTSTIYPGSNERDRSMQERTINATLKQLMDRLKGTKFYRNYTLSSEVTALHLEVTLRTIDEKIRKGRYYFSIEALGADLIRTIENMREAFVNNNNYNNQNSIGSNNEGKKALQEFEEMVKELFFAENVLQGNSNNNVNNNKINQEAVQLAAATALVNQMKNSQNNNSSGSSNDASKRRKTDTSSVMDIVHSSSSAVVAEVLLVAGEEKMAGVEGTPAES